jgi:hypothetical protein
VSIFAVIFTVESSRTFTFEDDNGDNGDDHLSLTDMNLIEEFDKSVKLNIFGDKKENFFVLTIIQNEQKEIIIFKCQS